MYWNCIGLKNPVFVNPVNNQVTITRVMNRYTNESVLLDLLAQLKLEAKVESIRNNSSQACQDIWCLFECEKVLLSADIIVAYNLAHIAVLVRCQVYNRWLQTVQGGHLTVCLSTVVMVTCILADIQKIWNLAKLDDGLDESPTVMVGEDNKQNSVKIGAY